MPPFYLGGHGCMFLYFFGHVQHRGDKSTVRLWLSERELLKSSPSIAIALYTSAIVRHYSCSGTRVWGQISNGKDHRQAECAAGGKRKAEQG
jgi:hypothetical protein